MDCERTALGHRGVVTSAALLVAWMAATPARAGEDALPVGVKPLRDVVVYPQLSAPATNLSLNDSRLSAQVAARILAIPVQVGQVVLSGKALALLDPADYQLQVAQAEAALRGAQAKLDLAEYQLQRAQTLAEKKAIADEQLRQRQAEAAGLKAERDALEAALAKARADLDRTTIRAPFKGVVMERLAKVGELTTPGAAVIRLLDLEHLEVSADVRAGDADSLAQATKPLFVNDDHQFPLRLRVVAPVVEERERSREARLTFADHPALPGAAGRLIWHDATPHVPPELLVRRGDQLGIFVLNGGRAHFVSLPGAQEGRPAAVSIPADSRIITGGRFKLQDGDTVAPQ